ncbi:MAG: hypothetical protein JM58_15075 [Peptococcaceae bacterium BICA1-8]|nr:MAG: hypothetical protein JM58_15075 [Peptococcaceae bacterium BICA1-8]
MTDTQFITLKKERNRLFDAWQITDTIHKNSILMRITDIDEELEEYQTKKSVLKKRCRRSPIPSDKDQPTSA